MTLDKVEEIVEEFSNLKAIDGYGLNRVLDLPGTIDLKSWLRTTLNQRDQDLMREVEKTRDQEAKLWFETWYSHYIAPEKPLPGEFAKFATERIQMTGYLRDEAQTIIKSK